MKEELKRIKKDYDDIIEHYGEEIDNLTVDNSFIKDYGTILSFCQTLLYKNEYLEKENDNIQAKCDVYKELVLKVINNNTI